MPFKVREDIGTHFIMTNEIRSPALVRELVNETIRLSGRAGKFQWWYIMDLSRYKNSYQRFSPADLERIEEVLTNHVIAGFTFKRSRSPYAELDVSFNVRTTAPKDPSLLNYHVEESYYQDAQSQAARVNALVNTVASLARITRPLFGRIHHGANRVRMTPALAGQNWDKQGFIPSIYWGTYFGRSLVSRFGVERLMQAPVWRACKISDEGVLLVLSPSPLNPESKESLEEQMGLINYLGIAGELREVHRNAYAERQKSHDELEQAIGRKVWREPYDVTGIPWLE